MASAFPIENRPEPSVSPSSSSSSIQSKLYDWELIEAQLSNCELKEFIKEQIPPSHVYQTNNRVKCYFCVDEYGSVNHNIKRQYRECIDFKDCLAIYRVDSCSQKDCCRVDLSGKHLHPVSDQYNNTNGLDGNIKKAIETILEHNPT